MLCASCRHDNPAGNRFCGRCGSQIQPSDAGDGERRQLTIMFCDLVGSTPLSRRIDPEDFSAVVGGFHEVCGRVIHASEGHVAQLLGDGVVAYFGYPRAHDDDAVRATAAALRITEELPRLNARLAAELPVLRDEPLEMRIGIHSGPVVLSDTGGGGHRQRLALGDTANLTARLQSRASPGTVVISEATRRLLGPLFETEDLGAAELKGVSEPQHLHRVIAARGTATRLELAAAEGLTPIAGREQELSLLLDRWELVQAPDETVGGRGQSALLVGEAGIGKSRLLFELRARLGEKVPVWLEGRCSPYDQNSAFQPILRILESVLRFEPDEPPEARLARLEEAVAQAPLRGQPADDALALLASRLALPLEEGRTIPLAPEAQRQRTLEVLLDWMLGLADRAPLVVVVEDVHWADPSTIELLTGLLDAAPNERVLLLLTARPDFSSPWGGRSDLTRLPLHPLNRRQVGEMVVSIARGEVPAEVLQHVAAKTDGVPLFVEELTKALIESDLLIRVPGKAGYELRGRLRDLAIPGTLQDSLMARLDRLGPGRRVAQVASVIGREFSQELLGAVMPRTSVGDLQGALEQLTRAGLVRRRGAPPRAVYTFRHAMTQETAHQSLLRARRREIHRRVARALEERFQERVEAQPEELARHWREAGDAERAAGQYLRAGDRATARGENAEAIGHLRQGIELLDELETGPVRDELELELQVALGGPLLGAKGQSHPEVEAAYGRALELCDQVGGSHRPPRFRALWGLARFYQSQGRLDVATELGEQLLVRAEQAGDLLVLPWAHLGLGLTSFWQGAPARAAAQLERAISHHDASVHRPTAASYGQDLDVTTHAFLGLAWWVAGHPDRARAAAERAVALGPEGAIPLSHAYALDYASAVFGLLGDTDRHRAYGEEAVAIASERGLPLWLAFGRVMVAWAESVARPGRAAVDGFRGALGGMSGTGTVLGAPFLLGMFAQAQAAAGDPGAAMATLEAALDAGRRQQSPFWDAELLRLQGKFRVARAEMLGEAAGEEAERCFHDALDIARKQAAGGLELRAATSLARRLAADGRRAEAKALLDPLCPRPEPGRPAPSQDLQEAQALLEQLGDEAGG